MCFLSVLCASRFRHEKWPGSPVRSYVVKHILKCLFPRRVIKRNCLKWRQDLLENTQTEISADIRRQKPIAGKSILNNFEMINVS